MTANEALSRFGLRTVQESVGEGGSAVVHKAEVIDNLHPDLPEIGSFVAVKQYRPTILAIEDQLKRIIQEGTIGRSIQSENVVKVYGHHHPDDDANDCFLFMEWVDGKTLDAWGAELRRNVAWEKLKGICSDIVSGVEELHSKGVLHRDIKPENVMVVADTAKIMDIGIAEKTGDNEHTLHTKVKDFIGSLRYASPQFILGEDFDYTDDVYSIGATLLELLSGSMPYADVERKPVLPIKIINGPPEIGALRDSVPTAVKVMIEGCLNRDRGRRPTLEEIRDVLESGGQSDYIKKEIQRKAVDQRGYEIIKIDLNNGGFYADIGSDKPELGQDYTVVRKDDPISVPSLNSDVTPEMWIAIAELRHLHQSLGHFKLTTKRWVRDEMKYRGSLRDIMSNGHWEEFDRKSVDVAIGDFVLKNEP